MNKGELIEAMASDAGISKSQAQLALNSFILKTTTSRLNGRELYQSRNMIRQWNGLPAYVAGN